MRLFTGIAIEDGTQRALDGWLHDLREEFPRLRWSPPEQWHVTLQFLGETDAACYACILKQMQRVCEHAVDIRLSQPGFFERAGVFHIAVQRTASLLILHDQTAQGLMACGFEPEARPYSPHITLARRKGRGMSPDFTGLQKRVRDRGDMNSFSFMAKGFLLYQSVTGPEGSRYEVRERFLLM